MGWEVRRGRRYYYHKARVGERVLSIYCGTGPAGQAAANADKAARARRAARRRRACDARARETELDLKLAELEEELAALTAACLYATGHHRHRGEWRRKRHAKR